MPRTYHVHVVRHEDSKGKAIKRYVVVTDEDEKEYFAEDADNRPEVARFPISILHEKDIQVKRAKELCDTLNAGLVAVRLNQT